jgi:hypothetical protein
MVGNDRGLGQGVTHDIKQGGGLQPPLSQEARHRGSACSHQNYTTDGERSGHSGHDGDSNADGGTVARYQPPFKATPHSSGGGGQEAQACDQKATTEQEEAPR